MFCKQIVDEFLKASQNKRIVLWGAGKFVQEIVEKYNNVECIIDSNPEKWGTKHCSLKVYSPEHLYALNPNEYIIYVTTAGNTYGITKLIKQVDDFKIFYHGVISDKFFEYFSNSLYDNYERIREVERNLADDRSKKVYRECVRRRIIGSTAGYNDLKTAEHQQYIFTPMYKNMCDEEVFIDCGGYIGDSIEKFVWAFGNKVNKIYSFECFEENVAKIRLAGETLQQEGWEGELVVEPYAVSDKNSKAIFNDIGKSESGYLPESRLTVEYNDKLEPVNTFEVETKRIDDVVKEGEKVTLIKMDIEGAEYEALKGAERIIRKYKPRLAISIYHNPQDYWRIYELIREFSSDYKFAVRHHQNNHLDTVLYAWEEK